MSQSSDDLWIENDYDDYFDDGFGEYDDYDDDGFGEFDDYGDYDDDGFGEYDDYVDYDVYDDDIFGEEDEWWFDGFGDYAAFGEDDIGRGIKYFCCLVCATIYIMTIKQILLLTLFFIFILSS